MSTLGSDVKVPKRRVLHMSESEGYRTGVRLYFILECGHIDQRPASKGRPQFVGCYECWAIATCDARGHTSDPCGRCAKARAKLGTAEQQIARYDGEEPPITEGMRAALLKCRYAGRYDNLTDPNRVRPTPEESLEEQRASGIYIAPNAPLWDRLIERGLIERRRGNRLRLTAQGERLLRRAAAKSGGGT